MRNASDPSTNRYMRAQPDRDGVLQRLYSSQFFSLQTFSTQTSLFSPPLAADVAKNWRQVMIENVLARMLPQGTELFRSRIVFEALMNAIRHPQADLIQTASIIRRPRTHSSEDCQFCVGFWDNGTLIPATLRAALKQGLRVTGDAFNSVNCEYWVFSGKEGKSRERIQPTRMPTASSSEEVLLLSALFPGITCDPLGFTRPAGSEGPPGMGLYYITNAVVSVFGGRLILQAGRTSLEIRQSRRAANPLLESFHVRLKTLPMSAWIDGNLLWVELPVSSPFTLRQQRPMSSSVSSP